jgi:glyoxylase-like metal-dependent hydrolase (beta-lactamase superfamily II)
MAAAAAAPAAIRAGALEVVRVPALSDNYVWLVHEPGSGKTAVVDPAEVAPVAAELKKRCGRKGWGWGRGGGIGARFGVGLRGDDAGGRDRGAAAEETPPPGPPTLPSSISGWGLDYVLNTHHHADHTGGNLELKRAFPGLQVRGREGRVALVRGGQGGEGAASKAMDCGRGGAAGRQERPLDVTPRPTPGGAPEGRRPARRRGAHPGHRRAAGRRRRVGARRPGDARV